MRIKCLHKAIAHPSIQAIALFLRFFVRRSLDIVWDNAEDYVYAELF
ncbi:hypothetical protein [Nostoc sp.]